MRSENGQHNMGFENGAQHDQCRALAKAPPAAMRAAARRRPQKKRA
jgi:hypothetical protein